MRWLCFSAWVCSCWWVLPCAATFLLQMEAMHLIRWVMWPIIGAGSFYFLGRLVERNGADVSHAGGDYGTRFLATAGVLNLLAALHAYEAARGRKA